MPTLQEQTEALRKRLESLHLLRNEIPDADEKIATAKRELAKKEAELNIQTQGGAFVAGEVNTQGGDFVGRDKITIYQGAYHGMAPKSPDEALEIYRCTLIDRCGLLPLQGLSDQTSDATTSRPRLSLPGVYIQLNTELAVSEEKLAAALENGQIAALDELLPERAEGPEMVMREMGQGKLLSALDATSLNRRLVLLGDPGSGKTTFINFLSYCMTAGNWDDLPGWPQNERTILPVLVTLRDFAYWLTGPQGREYQDAAALWEFIQYDLKMRNLDFVGPQLELAMQEGRALILLDGLDEVPPTEQARGAVLQIVQSFVQRYKLSRYLVTCRKMSYLDRQWQLEALEFPALTLAPFNDGQISAFIHAWHTEIAEKWNEPRQKLTNLENKLLAEVFRRADLKRLAPNPLLLTVMALVHTSDGELPAARALLYERAVDILLWRWDQQRKKVQGEDARIIVLLREVGRERGDLLVRLAKLAFEAHQQVHDGEDSEAVTGIPEINLLRELSELHPAKSLDWAGQVVETMKLRAGLLLERTGGTFTFPHRTFQEYLAGVHLARQSNFTAEALKCESQGDFWRIVILLAVGHLVHSNIHDYEKPRLLADELCPPEKKDTPQAWKRAWLAGEVLLELGINRAQDSDQGRRVLEQVRRRLTSLLESGKLTPQERLEAASVLASLGDPRFDPQTLHLPRLYREKPEPLLGFVKIPAGPFIMGSAKDDKDAADDEKPAHTVELPEFYIARYPVTNAQYRHFMDEKGYEKDQYWTPEGLAWRNGAEPDFSAYNVITDEKLKEAVEAYKQWILSRKNRLQPYYLGHLVWGAPTRPVVGVCWYESLAYCNWLSEQLIARSEQLAGKKNLNSEQRVFWELLASGQGKVNLPSESQWEKAARGASGLRWPWGDEWKKDHANIDETELKQTNPVGLFPKGKSPYGLLDLAGNTWEWTCSRWGKQSLYNPDPEYGYPTLPGDQERNDPSGSYLRILRGGSWNNYGRHARCAGRNGYIPDLFPINIGFRCVVSLAISEF